MSARFVGVFIMFISSKEKESSFGVLVFLISDISIACTLRLLYSNRDEIGVAGELVTIVEKHIKIR